MNAPSPASSSSSEFDPALHRMVAEQRYFDDFRLGERFVLPSRTMTHALFSAFQLASGDNHPSHYDLAYCRRQGSPEVVAHGFQVLVQTVAGAGLFPHLVEESLHGLIAQSSRFLRRVHAGDTLYAVLEVSELVPSIQTGLLSLSSTVHNQHSKLVMEGVQKYVLRRRAVSGRVFSRTAKGRGPA